MKPRILIIVNDETTIYNFRREILKAFYDQGYDVTLCIPKGNHTKEIKECGCKVVNIEVNRHGKNPLQDIKILKTCIQMIDKYKPNLVLTYTVKPNIYGSIACQIKKVPYINNVTGLGSVLQKKSALARLLLGLQRIAYRKSSCVFFQNESNYKTLLAKKVISEKTHVEILPGSGVNLDLHSYIPMRADDGTIRFVIVSRIRADKGYDEFFNAAEVIKEKNQGTEFHVIGWYEEETYRKRIENLIDKKVIIYHGQLVQDEVHRIVAECDCSVLVSYHEGMANVLLEAAATGRPVIASRVPGCQETFEEGLTGYGCEVKSVESLVEAMEKMINTPYDIRVQMGINGRKKMEKEFDRRFVAERYINRIEDTIGKQKHGTV